MNEFIWTGISPYLIKDYSRSNMTRPIYKKGKPLAITEKEYNELLIRCKESLIEYLNINVKNIQVNQNQDKAISTSNKDSTNRYEQCVKDFNKSITTYL